MRFQNKRTGRDITTSPLMKERVEKAKGRQRKKAKPRPKVWRVIGGSPCFVRHNSNHRWKHHRIKLYHEFDKPAGREGDFYIFVYGPCQLKIASQYVRKPG